jgi:DNA processing protein
MDNGLDIVRTRCALALHAALFHRPRRLQRLLVELARARNRGLDGRDLAALAAEMLAPYGLAPAWDLAEAALSWRQEPGREFVWFGSEEYPNFLAEIADPPPLLFVDGNPSTLLNPQIAIVGSRKASPYGLRNASDFARALGAAGLTVTSGLAIGVDAAAHRGALAAAAGTVAVLGCGIDVMYPWSNRALAAEIVQRGGAIVSELPCGSPPRAGHFPRRNRIISGLARGVVVIEAAKTSGSISTANHALEQGRDVFAVPGSIHSTQSEGCLELLKQGACLVRGPDDVLQELQGFQNVPTRAAPQKVGVERSPADLGRDEVAVLELCGWEPISVEALVDSSGLTVGRVSSILSTLEVKGYVQSLAGGSYQRVSPIVSGQR